MFWRISFFCTDSQRWVIGYCMYSNVGDIVLETLYSAESFASNEYFELFTYTVAKEWNALKLIAKTFPERKSQV